MRLDAHQHFWNYDPSRYAWISEAMPELRRDWLPEHLAPLLAASTIDGTIAVQARQDEDETRWLLDLARLHPFIRGVVGWTDLRAADAPARLEILAADPALCGLRHGLQDEADDRFILREDFRRGLGLLRRHGLVYDLLLHPRHLPHALPVLDSLPGQRFVLDHLAKPFIAEGRLDPWQEDLRALSRRPNVAIKLSGLVTEAVWRRWTRGQFQPYLDHALECFGPGRILFGSDWPVCLLSGEYAAVLELIEAWASRLAAAERRSLFGETAAAIYLRRSPQR